MVKIKEMNEESSDSNGTFWGVAMQGGKRYTQKVIRPFHISMAALEPVSLGGDVGNGLVSVWLGSKGYDYLLCTLKHDSLYNVALDYELDMGEEINLHVTGKGTVYLTGFIRPEEPQDQDWDYDDSDQESEPELEFPESESEDDDDDELIPSKAKPQSKRKALLDGKAKNAFNAKSKNVVNKVSPKVEVMDADNTPGAAGKKKRKNKRRRSENSVTIEELPAEEAPAAAKGVKVAGDKGADKKNAAVVEKNVEASPKKDLSVKSPMKGSAEASKKGAGNVSPTKAPAQSPKKDSIAASPTKSLEVDPAINSALNSIRKEVDEKSKEKTEGEPKAVAAEGAVNPTATPQSDKKKKKKNRNKNKNNESANESSLDDSLNVTPSKATLNGFAGNKSKPSPAKSGAIPGAKFPAVTLPGGVVVSDHDVGSGDEARKGSTCFVRYTARLKSTNKVIDSNTRPSESPLRHVVGSKDLISGFDEGLEGMKVGGKRRLILPPHKAYGNKPPSKDIPPNSSLVFDVELVKMVGKKGQKS